MDDENQPLLPPHTWRLPDGSGTGPPVDYLALSAPSAVPRPRWKTHTAFFLILLTETFERIAFYGVVCNMVLFVNSVPLLWASYNAVNAIFVLNGLSYLAAIFGGWLADSMLGKFRAILLAFMVYVAGFAFWPMFSPYPFKSDNRTVPLWCASGGNRTDHDDSGARAVGFGERMAWYGVSEENFTWLSTAGPVTDIPDPPEVPWERESCAWAVYLSIAIMSLGYGTVRANIIPFGAHQVEHEGQTSMRFYFNWFYWCINIGALISYGVLGYVQQDQNYFWGYIAPLAVLIAALLVFVSGSCIYIKKSVTGSVITNILSVCKESLQLYCRSRRRRDTEIFNSDFGLQGYERAPCCVDFARARYGGSFADGAVDDIKQLCKIIVVFLAMIPYWIVYYQMQTTFVVQGLHMQLDFDYDNDSMAAADQRQFTLPAAWLSLFNVIFVLLLVPVLDRLVYPALDRAGWSPSLKTRIIIGMSVAVAAILAAGVTEHFRLTTYWEGDVNHTHYQKIGGTYYLAAKMSVFYQLPQYALIGISELFAIIGGLELAYIYAPLSMQGIIMGLYWFSQGLGSILGTALLSAFKSVWFTPWDHGDINCRHSPFKEPYAKCHLDYYFFFLSSLLVVGIVIFAAITWAVGIGSRVALRVQEDGHVISRSAGEAGGDSGPSTRSASPNHLGGSGSGGGRTRRSNSRTESTERNA